MVSMLVQTLIKMFLNDGSALGLLLKYKVNAKETCHFFLDNINKHFDEAHSLKIMPSTNVLFRTESKRQHWRSSFAIILHSRVYGGKSIPTLRHIPISSCLKQHWRWTRVVSQLFQRDFMLKCSSIFQYSTFLIYC